MNSQRTNRIKSMQPMQRGTNCRKEIVMSVRVSEHIILGDQEESKMVTITVDGEPMQAEPNRN